MRNAVNRKQLTENSEECISHSGVAAGRLLLAARGFTFIEMIVVIALTVLISGTMAGLIQYFYKTNNYVLQQTQAVNSARASIQAATRDLREASYGADGSYPIVAASTSTITFFANIDTDVAFEKVRYYLSSTTLYRGGINPVGSPATYAGQTETTSLVIPNIQNGTTPIFRYFDANGTELASPVNIRQIASITITILTDVDPNRSPVTYTLSANATLRNLRNPATE